MKYQPYPAYKSSGIEWLGEIPEHWEIKPVKYVGQFYTGWTPPTGRDEYFIGDNLWANISDLGPKILEGTAKRISNKAIKESRLKISPKGSLLFSFKLSIGQVSIAGADMYTNEAIATFPPDNGTDVAYLYWAAPFYIPHNADENIYGAKLLNQDLIKNARIAFPPEAEQHSIAAFLDRETARIDTLIEKKQRQIELLQEKRAALISHAVTKGLNPNVKMKDSGIEWLGKIPEHWRLLSIKRLTLVKRGASPRPIDDPKYFDEEGEYAWVRIADVTASSRYLETTTQRLSELGKSLSVPLEPGDLFLSIAGTVGKPIITKIKCCIHDGFVYFPQYRENKEFLYYVFASGQPYHGLGKWGTQLNLNTNIVGGIHIGLPPEAEQDTIVAYLDQETARIDALIEKIRKSIDLLHEYRTALITAAVTGKIDVRKEVA